MKRVGKYIILTEEELRDERDKNEELAYERGKEWAEGRIENLEKQIKKHNKHLEALEEEHEDEVDSLKKANERAENKSSREVTKLKEYIKVLESDRDEARDVMTAQMHNEDVEAVLNQKKEDLDALTARLKDREAKVGKEEEGEYKRGYADGVSDGVRKVNEITQKDRDNAMKVAMVAASSHTPVQNMKEVMNVSRQLTAGDSDSETKES